MKITKKEGPPEDIIHFDTEYNELNLTSKNVEDICEIFKTPLTGAYNWDYTVADNRIKKLYELGKELNWNGSIDLNWEYTHPKDEFFMQADEDLPHEALEAYKALSDEEKLEFNRHDLAELMSQFLHGEQGALLVALNSLLVPQHSMQNFMQRHKHLMKQDMLRSLIDIFKKKLVCIIQ